MDNREMFYGANANIFSKAKELRNRLTPEEIMLWEMLSKKQLNGFKFRRQHPIGSFIADFYCHKAKLVIEIDGSVHDVPENRIYDKGRDFEINELGLKVLRFENFDIRDNMEGVLKLIKSALNSQTGQ